MIHKHTHGDVFVSLVIHLEIGEILCDILDGSVWRTDTRKPATDDWYGGIACVILPDRHLHQSIWDFVRSFMEDISFITKRLLFPLMMVSPILMA